MQPAPFRQLPGTAAPPAQAWRVRAPDGVALRIGLWRAATMRGAAAPRIGSDGGHADSDTSRSAGTVLLFPGRTEYIEKYAPVAARLTQAGHDVLGIDWRGQGASDRLQDDPVPGHIDDFARYQHDVAALVATAEALSLPRPWFLLAHSMGGCIGLRALVEGLPVAAAAFSAPMWGIAFARVPEAVGAGLASSLAHAAGRTGRGLRAIPGPSSVLDVGFAQNPLTSDLDSYIRFMREAAAWPDLVVGAASYDWVRAAIAECRALARLPSPDRPAVISLSGGETIVSRGAIRRRAAVWPGAQLLALPGARHEALFERPDCREPLLEAVLALFARNG